MLKGIDIRQRIEFSSSLDTNEPKTIFVLKPLTSLETTHFSTLHDDDQLSALRFYIKSSIVQIKNFETEDVDEAINLLDSTTLGELLTEINKINKVSKDDVKNS